MQEGKAETKPAAPEKPSGKPNAPRSFADKVLSVLESEYLLGAIVLIIMMLLTVSDVIGRYFFNHPVQGTNEITGLLLVLVAASALAYSQIKKGHIRVDLISGRLSPRGQIILDVIAYFFCLFASVLITWQTFVRGITYFHATRGNLTETLGIPFFPFMLILGLGFFLLSIVSLIDFVRALTKAVEK